MHKHSVPLRGDDAAPIRNAAMPEPLAPETGSMTIGELARQAGVTLRALRFYQSKGLLAPRRDGAARVFSEEDRDRLDLILQGKRLGFTLWEIRDMLAARGGGKTLPISRNRCVEQVKLLEAQRRDIELALAELRQIYTGMFNGSFTGTCSSSSGSS